MMQQQTVASGLKLLFLSLDFPFPANNGHRLRNWALLCALRAEGHQITLLTFAPPGEPSQSALDRVSEICSETTIVPLALPKASAARSLPRAALSVFSSVPYSVLRFRSAAMQSMLSTLLASRRFDAVICETCYPVINFPEALDLPLILDNHNLEHVVVERFCRYERNPLKRAYAELEWRKMRNWERITWRRADRVIVCSEHDRAQGETLLKGLGAAVVPNVVDVDEYQAKPEGDGATILYVGGMDWFPNRDAVKFFAFRVLPGLSARFPNLKFVVAGRGPDPHFRALFKGGNVSFTGSVPDIRPTLSQADICIVPLRIGSGTRLKILEAAAAGKAIVSTSIGAEGLDFVDGREILLANTEQEFGDAVARLLADPSFAARLGRAARARVEAQYSYAAMRSAVRRVLMDSQIGGAVAAKEGEALWRSSTR